MFELAIILIILSDFKILRFGITRGIYFWIEYPEKIQRKIDTLNEIYDIMDYNHKAKKYVEETKNQEIKIVGVEDGFFVIGTTNVFKSIKKGLQFTLFFKDMFEYLGEKVPLPSQDIFLVEIIQVGKLSKGKIIQEFKSSSSYKNRIKNLKEGRLEGVSASLRVKLDEDFENASSEELEVFLKLINKIKRR